MSATSELVVPEWTADGQRPAGQPGEVGRNHGAGASWTYPAVTDVQGNVWFWRDTTDSAGRWIAAPPMLADSFTPGEDWMADCDHAGPRPHMTCDTEADCISLRRERERTWGR